MVDRQDTKDAEKRPSSRSIGGLLGLNFLMADVAGGLGPYLSVYLAGSQHWGPGDIGVAMAASGVAAAAFQIPAGFLVDVLRIKRFLIAGSGVVIAIGCILTAAFPAFANVIVAQVMIGRASAIIPPAISAMTLGLVGRKRFDGQTSRNQTFNHGGNFVTAILAGTLGQYLGYNWIFYLVCAFAVASAVAVAFIKPSEIDDELARGGETHDASGSADPLPLRDLFKHRTLLIFLASVLLFHFGNAAMLPMAGQVLAKTHPGQDTIALSACIISAQFVMMGIAWAVGRAMAKGYGRKAIFLIAFQRSLGGRRGLTARWRSSRHLRRDLHRYRIRHHERHRRFNFAQGLVALAVGIGASLSNVVAGYVVQCFGYPAGFMFLAAVAAIALVFFAVSMPETGTANDGDGSDVPLQAAAIA